MIGYFAAFRAASVLRGTSHCAYCAVMISGNCFSHAYTLTNLTAAAPTVVVVLQRPLLLLCCSAHCVDGGHQSERGWPNRSTRLLPDRHAADASWSHSGERPTMMPGANCCCSRVLLDSSSSLWPAFREVTVRVGTHLGPSSRVK